MQSQSRPGLRQYGNAQTRDQAVQDFWENPRLGLGPLGLVWSRSGPNQSGTEFPQHYCPLLNTGHESRVSTATHSLKPSPSQTLNPNLI